MILPLNRLDPIFCPLCGLKGYAIKLERDIDGAVDILVYHHAEGGGLDKCVTTLFAPVWNTAVGCLCLPENSHGPALQCRSCWESEVNRLNKKLSQ